ncbi:hypothetical protein [Herbiconiux liukaitaii]|uniref:hypothetical protein n=1 Tax=Herbiconiux liukaitaii TaxID=3342799 RepID=UPI0035BAB08D
MSSSPEPWVTESLTLGRFGKYSRAAGGDHGRALAVYDWNAKRSASLLHDLGHLEVGLRNAYDRALLSHPLVSGKDWIDPAVAAALLPPHLAPNGTGEGHDKNAISRNSIKQACKRARYTETNGVDRGKVIAELMFGFWTYLTDSLHEKTLWVPTLHKAYLPGADRGKLHLALRDLRDVRNRLAHNESVYDRRPENQRRSIVYVAKNLSEPLRQHIDSRSSVRSVLEERP